MKFADLDIPVPGAWSCRRVVCDLNALAGFGAMGAETVNASRSLSLLARNVL